MNDLDTISLTRSVMSAAAQRAKQQGLSTEEFVMQVLMRELEIDPRERTILAYDAAAPGSQSVLEREENESDDHYQERSLTLRMLFP